MTASRADIRLSTLIAGAAKGIPHLPMVIKGLHRLASMKRSDIDSIGSLIESAALKHPNNVALLFEEKKWTYGEFNAWANRCAAAYLSHGIKSGDRIAIMMENRAEVLAAVAGATKIGAVASMINSNQRGDSLTHSLKLSEPKIIVVSADCLEGLCTTPFAPATSPAKIFWVGDGEPPAHCLSFDAEAESQSGENHAQTANIKAGDPCFYIFTSGTTGLPKASVMTHYRWLRVMAGVGQMSVRLQPSDILYCALPLYHNNALTVSWSSAIGSGAALAIGRKFSASRFWDEVRRYEATAFCYIGELCRYLLNQPAQPSDREHAIHTVVGNGLRADLWEQFETRFGISHIAEFYGASESNLVFINGLDQRKTAGFCPLPYAIVEFDAEHECAKRNRKGFLNKVARNGTGLLITEISEKSPFDGYTDRKASEGKLLHNVFKKGDCWFNTGDLVRDQGYRHIAFVDRVGDTFRWKGENVATTEVEGAICGFTGIEHAVVYGVQIPNTDGRAGMAAISLANGRFDGVAMAKHVRAELPGYAVPLFIRIREQQDTTSTLKYSKVELKRQAFDPHQIAEPLYVLLGAGRGYEPLTKEIYAQIAAGAVRF
jgi:acyl-CoA synthetase (AMP-forming)/AMP-acid ligase II